MGTLLDLINLAVCGDLGEETELTDASLEADPAPRALRVARRFTNTLRDEFLRRHPWLCAEADLILTPSTDPALASWRYAYGYVLPVDCLRVWNVSTSSPWQRGAIEILEEDGTLRERRDAIISDHNGALNVTITRRIDWARMDPCLFRAMAAELAARMAGPLQADKALRKILKDEAERTLAIAVTCETSEFGNSEPEFRSAWMEAR